MSNDRNYKKQNRLRKVAKSVEYRVEHRNLPKSAVTTEEAYLNTFNLKSHEREYYETKHNHYERPGGAYNYGMDTQSQDYICSTMDWHRKNAEQQAKVELLISLLKASITNLTDKQKAILELYLQGHTQSQIAKFLGIAQTNVQKTLHGNWDQKYQKYFGGIIPKLRKLITKQAEAQGFTIEEILQKGFDEL